MKIKTAERDHRAYSEWPMEKEVEHIKSWQRFGGKQLRGRVLEKLNIHF